MKVQHVSTDASNPYFDFARLNNLNYGDVLNYVGILDGEKRTVWHDKAMRLGMCYRISIENLRLRLKDYYFKNV